MKWKSRPRFFSIAYNQLLDWRLTFLRLLVKTFYSNFLGCRIVCICTIYTWTCAVLTGVFAVPPAAALTAVPALDADLETGLEVLITWASLSRLNLSSSIWRTFRCSSSRVCGWWWWWLSTSESSPSPELERLALENKKHIKNTAWESNKNLAGIIYLNFLGMARTNSSQFCIMMPSCVDKGFVTAMNLGLSRRFHW